MLDSGICELGNAVVVPFGGMIGLKGPKTAVRWKLDWEAMGMSRINQGIVISRHTFSLNFHSD